MTTAFHAHVHDGKFCGEAATPLQPHSDAATLRDIVERLAKEASTLGIDLVDIAGAIQDVAGTSNRLLKKSLFPP